MSQIKLTKSQEQAIESQKKTTRMVHGDNNIISFRVWEKTDSLGYRDVYLTCDWTIKNALGGKIEKSTTWTIGKRGKVWL